MTRRLKPWPLEFAGEYRVLMDHSLVLARMAKVALEHGVGGHRNLPLLEQLLPLMLAELRGVQNTVLSMRQQRRGRWPYWVNECLDNVITLAAGVLRPTRLARRDLKRGDLKTAKVVIESCLEVAQKMERELREGPPPDEDGVQAVAMRVAERAWRR